MVFSASLAVVREGASSLKDELASKSADRGIDVLGPVESPVFKLGKLYKYQILLKVPLDAEPAELLAGINDFTKRFKGLGIKIDVDPVSFM